MCDISELVAALAKAQGQIAPAPKDAVNPYFRTRYATLAAVREVMRQPFADNGLSLVHVPSVHESFLVVRSKVWHASGQYMDVGTMRVEVDVTDPQKIGSAMTYIRRYVACCVAGVVADDDDDGNAASPPPAAAVRKQAPSKPRQPSEDDKTVQRILKGIATADETDLEAIGNHIKTKSQNVQDAVAEAYDKRQQFLRGQANADSQKEVDRRDTQAGAAAGSGGKKAAAEGR